MESAYRRQQYADQSIERQDFRDANPIANVEETAPEENTTETKKICAPGLLPEVTNMNFQKKGTFSLQTLRFTLNLSNRQGVDLFRTLHRWMCIDVENERFGADVVANLLLTSCFGLLLGCALSLVQHRFVPTENHAFAGLGFIVLFAYFLNICNLCIEMNEALFQETDVSLLEWSDMASSPSGEYIAELWDRKLKQRKIFTGEETEISKERVPLEVRAMIQIGRERIQRLDTPSSLLGMSITKELRNRILTLVITAALGALTGVAKKYAVGEPGSH